MVVAAVRARLRRRHRAAGVAPERVLEEHRLDAELVRLELVEDELRVVGAVVVADARVVAADDEVRAAEVLAADRVPDRLARACVAHRGRERGHDHAVGRVVVVDEDAVALDARRGGHVVGLRLADERVDEQAVDGLERALRQVLVRAVDRVAGLEADDAAPASLRERLARVSRDRGRAPGTAARAGRRRSPCRRGRAGAARRGARLRDAPRRSCGSSCSASRSLSYSKTSSTSSTASGRPSPSASATRSPCGCRFDGEADGKSPGEPVREVHVLDDALVVLAAHEALERRERARREHVQVGHLTRGQRRRLERSRSSGRSPVRSTSDPPCGAIRLSGACHCDCPGVAHAGTSSWTRPSSASLPRMSPALSSGVPALGVDAELGALGRLVRVRDAGELLDLAGERLLVEALHVALGAASTDASM